MAGDGDAGGPTTEWECPHCTLLNDDASSMCAVCSNPRPRGDDADEAARGQEEQPGGAAPDGMWCCGVCTYHNAAFSARCVICSQVREAPAIRAYLLEALASPDRRARPPRPARAPARRRRFRDGTARQAGFALRSRTLAPTWHPPSDRARAPFVAYSPRIAREPIVSRFHPTSAPLEALP